jgi:transposase
LPCHFEHLDKARYKLREKSSGRKISPRTAHRYKNALTMLVEMTGGFVGFCHFERSEKSSVKKISPRTVNRYKFSLVLLLDDKYR